MSFTSQLAGCWKVSQIIVGLGESEVGWLSHLVVGGWLGRSHLTGILSRKYPPLNSQKLATLVQKTTFYQASHQGSIFGFNMTNTWHYERKMIIRQYSSRKNCKQVHIVWVVLIHFLPKSSFIRLSKIASGVPAICNSS